MKFQKYVLGTKCALSQSGIYTLSNVGPTLLHTSAPFFIIYNGRIIIISGYIGYRC